MLYSEFKERQNRFATALKIGAPFLGLMIVYMSVFAIFDIKDNNFVLLLLFILVYIYYIFYMIYVGFEKSLIDDYTNAFSAETITEEIQRFIFKKQKSGFVAMVNISNVHYIEEQYGIWVKNQILKKIVEKLDKYLLVNDFKRVPIGRYQSGNFLLIFDNMNNERHLKHILTGFCKEVKTEGIFKIEVKANAVVIEKTYDDDVKNIILKLMDIANNVTNELRDILKPSEFDFLVKNAVESKNFEFTYHALRKFENTYEDPQIFTVHTKINIDHYGSLALSQVSSSVKKNGYEIKFDQLMLSSILNEIKSIFNRYNYLKFIIKISAVSFRNRSFFIFVKELLKDIDIEPSNICFLLYEKKIYDEFDRFRTIIDEYRDLGFCVMFEHFGADNAGIEYLKHDIRFDMVNFDLEFIKNIDDKNHFEILKILVDTTKMFNVKSLIRFVDKEHVLHMLQEINPDFVQGFLLDKPKNIKEF